MMCVLCVVLLCVVRACVRVCVCVCVSVLGGRARDPFMSCRNSVKSIVPSPSLSIFAIVSSISPPFMW